MFPMSLLNASSPSFQLLQSVCEAVMQPYKECPNSNPWLGWAGDRKIANS